MRFPFLSVLFFLPLLLGAEDLERASLHQQTALAELIQSLKSTREILVRSSGGGEPPPPNPFRNRQEFRLPPMPEKENPARRMEDLITRQEELNRKMRSSSEAQDLAGEQRKLRKEASELAKQGNLNLNSAEKSMTEAEKMLNSNKPAHALLAGQKAVSELRRRAKEFGEKADRRMRETLQRMQETLSDAMEHRRSGLPGTMKNMAHDLLAEAMDQHRSGKQTHADALARLAEKADHGARARKPLEAAEELSSELETLRMMDRSPEEILRTGTQRLTELGRQMLYSSRHPETMTPEEHRKLRSELRMELDDARLALSEILRSSGREESAETALNAARNALKLLSPYPASSHGGSAGKAASSSIAAETARLVAAAERTLGRIQISGTVSVFNPEDVPERYRKEVGEYFKRLSEKQQRKEKEKR